MNHTGNDGSMHRHRRARRGDAPEFSPDLRNVRTIRDHFGPPVDLRLPANGLCSSIAVTGRRYAKDEAIKG
jgi:hypothetical protein